MFVFPSILGVQSSALPDWVWIPFVSFLSISVPLEEALPLPRETETLLSLKYVIHLNASNSNGAGGELGPGAQEEMTPLLPLRCL